MSIIIGAAPMLCSHPPSLGSKMCIDDPLTESLKDVHDYVVDPKLCRIRSYWEKALNINLSLFLGVYFL